MPTLAPKLPYDHPFAGGYPRLGGQPLPTDPDAIDYLNRVAAADGAAVEVGVAMAVDAFVRGCKADGIWDAIKASCIMCGARTISGALVPLVGAAPTPYNFAGGDYSRTTGLKGDGSTKYLGSNRAGDADGQDDVHISRYATVAGTRPVYEVHIGMRGSPVFATTQIGYSATGGFNFLAARNETQRAAVYGPQYTGFAAAARSASDVLISRINGSTQSGPSTSETPPGVPYYVFARNSNGSIDGHSDARLAFYSIGSAIPDLAALDNRVSTLVAAIAAAI